MERRAFGQAAERVPCRTACQRGASLKASGYVRYTCGKARVHESLSVRVRFYTITHRSQYLVDGPDEVNLCLRRQGFGGPGARVHFTRGGPGGGGFSDPNDIFAQFFGARSPFDVEGLEGIFGKRSALPLKSP